MISPSSDFSPAAGENQPLPLLSKIPRIDSLLHQLQRAKDDAGQPIPLLDELFLLLDDPPPGNTDRWQKGAELCQAHGIQTSRTSVWRVYRAHVLQWRREQIPAPPATPPQPEETARLHDQACHLAAQRVLEMLNDPRLSPGHLIGFVQNENQRRQIQLARDMFNDRLALRRQLAQQQTFRQMDDEIRNDELLTARLDLYRKILSETESIPHHSTPSRNIPVPPGGKGQMPG